MSPEVASNSIEFYTQVDPNIADLWLFVSEGIKYCHSRVSWLEKEAVDI